MYKTPLLIITLCLIFEILGNKVTLYLYVTSDQAPHEALYIVLYGKGANAKLFLA